ncbi:MAG: RNA-binding protein [Bryobacterales bacterium]
MKRLFVGNLSFNSDEHTVREAFTAYGDVNSVHLVTDRDTGQPRGFGFVEMADATEAQTAIDSLNGTMLDGRSLNVNEARPRPERTGGGGGRRW